MCEAAFVTLQIDVVAGARASEQGRDACHVVNGVHRAQYTHCHALVDTRPCSLSSKPRVCNRPSWFDISRFLLERCRAVKPCQTSSGGGPK